MRTLILAIGLVALTPGLASPPAAAFLGTGPTCSTRFEMNGWNVETFEESWEVRGLRQVKLPKDLKTLKGKTKAEWGMRINFGSDDFDRPYFRKVMVEVPRLKRGKTAIDWNETHDNTSRYIGMFGAKDWESGGYKYIPIYRTSFANIVQGRDTSAAYDIFEASDVSGPEDELNRNYKALPAGGDARLVVADMNPPGATRKRNIEKDPAVYEAESVLVLEDMFANIENIYPAMMAAQTKLKAEGCD